MDNKSHHISPSSSSSDHHHHQYHNQLYQQQQRQQYLMNASLHYSQSPHLSLDLNDDDKRERNDDDDDENDDELAAGAEAGLDEEEPMFEKPLTPSDVGKLNRLVIPKQHAEKYFPLGAGAGGDATAEKGLLLSFEDESGKSWRFRYSYWNSSQSYVLTKGWSRYVKEKRLDAGDVVLFKRHRRDGDRLFIGWRRRAAATQEGGGGASRGGGRGFYNAPSPYPAHHQAGHYRNNSHSHSHSHSHVAGAGFVPYQPDCIHGGLSAPIQTTSLGNMSMSNNNNSSNTNNSSKILRLFGVNLECHDHHHHDQSSEPSTPDDSSLSSHAHPNHHHFYPSPNYYSDHQYHDHMDFTFSRDLNPMRNRRA